MVLMMRTGRDLANELPSEDGLRARSVQATGSINRKRSSGSRIDSRELCVVGERVQDYYPKVSRSEDKSIKLGSYRMQNRLQCEHLLWRLHLGDLPLNHHDVMLYATPLAYLYCRDVKPVDKWIEGVVQVVWMQVDGWA